MRGGGVCSKREVAESDERASPFGMRGGGVCSEREAADSDERARPFRDVGGGVLSLCEAAGLGALRRRNGDGARDSMRAVRGALGGGRWACGAEVGVAGRRKGSGAMAGDMAGFPLVSCPGDGAGMGKFFAFEEVPL